MDNRYVQQCKKGALEMILLCLIDREEIYGREIIRQLNQRSSVLGEYDYFSCLGRKPGNFEKILVCFHNGYDAVAVDVHIRAPTGFVSIYTQRIAII